MLIPILFLQRWGKHSHTLVLRGYICRHRERRKETILAILNPWGTLQRGVTYVTFLFILDFYFFVLGVGVKEGRDISTRKGFSKWNFHGEIGEFGYLIRTKCVETVQRVSKMGLCSVLNAYFKRRFIHPWWIDNWQNWYSALDVGLLSTEILPPAHCNAATELYFEPQEKRATLCRCQPSPDLKPIPSAFRPFFFHSWN